MYWMGLLHVVFAALSMLIIAQCFLSSSCGWYCYLLFTTHDSYKTNSIHRNCQSGNFTENCPNRAIFVMNAENCPCQAIFWKECCEVCDWCYATIQHKMSVVNLREVFWGMQCEVWCGAMWVSPWCSCESVPGVHGGPWFCEILIPWLCQWNFVMWGSPWDCEIFVKLIGCDAVLVRQSLALWESVRWFIGFDFCTRVWVLSMVDFWLQRELFSSSLSISQLMLTLSTIQSSQTHNTITHIFHITCMLP